MAGSIIFKRENICSRLSASLHLEDVLETFASIKECETLHYNSCGKILCFVSIIPSVKGLYMIFVNELINLCQFSGVLLHVVWSKS